MGYSVQKINKTFRDKYGIIAFFALYSAFLLTFCSMCSFLFPLHDRVDQNVFFTIGREMLNGKVIYRDMFDHKGPLTYFIHAFAALISSNSFIGVYFVEILSLTAFLYFAYRTALLFSGKTYSVACSSLLGALILTSQCFLRGDNVEELCLPLIMIPAFYMMRSYKLPNNPYPKEQSLYVSFLNGILFGLVLWIKFTLIGFWIGWALITFVPLLIKKNFKLFFKFAASFACGFALTAVPWILYFAYKGALYDFLYTYFYCNIFLYSNDIPVWMHLVSILIGVEKNVIGNLALIASTVYGFVRLCKIRVFSPLITYIGLYAGIFFSGRWYDYYYLMLSFYALFGIVYVCKDVSHFTPIIKEKLHKRLGRHIQSVLISVFILICAVYSVICSNCARFYTVPEEAYAQNAFAEYIKNSGIENPTLLNYGFIDQGFYFAAGISPVNKYFCRVNIPYSALPEMYDQQKELIDNKEVDFVVVRINGANKSIENDYISFITEPVSLNYQNPSYSVDPDKLPLLFENYELVMEDTNIAREYKFGLFRKKT